jgi:SAM-dependent methyltransferase
MSEAERDEWDRRYAAGDYRPRSWPSPFLEGWLGRIPASGRALDVACGAGRNALRLAEAGFDVDAVDISAVAVEQARAEAQRRGLEVRWHVADLDDLAVAEGRYRLITVIRYRNRSLWPRLVTALAPDGWLLAEHHFRTSAAVDGPSDTFRLEPGELLEAFGGLRVLLYEEAIETDRDGSTFALQRIVACSGDPGV